MPIPNPNEARCAPDKAGKKISLTVLPGGGQRVRKSRMGSWRAIVLIGVNLLIVARLLTWWLMGQGPTLSPIEPSESMYTLEKGLINAGFVFFALAILSTLVFGRFVCGWGCHIVALQDLCGWVMKKLGVRPRPFRSRLLVLAPVALAFWMFVKPTLVREIVKPLTGQHWTAIAPYIGEVAPRPELRAAFVKQDFWETFPAWYVAVPFLIVCGFGCVYFLGNKGFCTFGCPYGGVFMPGDKLAIGHILVNDSCEHCGHCTTVCSSNVRVHEEVRDYGMVVDPGCMKCMDCVSVCPNEALSFGFARPALFVKPRTPGRHPRFKARVHDLSWPGEIAAAVLFLALVMAFRGCLGQVPLLMAMALAAIGVYLAWKLVQMIVEPSVSMQHLQLKFKGRPRPAGVVIGAVAIATLATAAWSGVVRFSAWRGVILDDQIALSFDQVLSPGFKPGEADAALAARTEKLLRRATPPAHGGIGWKQPPELYLRLARLDAIGGRFDEAEHEIRRALAVAAPTAGEESSSVQRAWLSVLNRRAASADDIVAACREVLGVSPHLFEVRLRIAQIELGRQNREVAIREAEAAADQGSRSPFAQGFAGQILVQAGQPEKGLPRFQAAAKLDPHVAGPRIGQAVALTMMGRMSEAEVHARAATELEPQNPGAWQVLGGICSEQGKEADAAACDAKVQDILSRRAQPSNR